MNGCFYKVLHIPMLDGEMIYGQALKRKLLYGIICGKRQANKIFYSTLK
ncbi:MAG: hypothetical protein IPP72_15430 [Chitinophagaceae bacterium]|nr:hypothetical protein [Chitinophagaceae bacterium]